jgi:hypothetical protein
MCLTCLRYPCYIRSLSQSESHAYEKFLLSRLHVSRFQTVRVHHCRDAYALVLETRGFRAVDSLLRSDSVGSTQSSTVSGSASSLTGDGDADRPGFKLSFSGDCRPSDNFIEVCAFYQPMLEDLCVF